MIIRMRQIRTHDVTGCGLNTLLKCHPSSSSPCRLETVKLLNLPLHSGRGSLSPTPHILLTSHNIRDEHSWTKTSLNRTVQVVKRRHAKEGREAVGSGGKHDRDGQASPGASVYELGLGKGQQQLHLQS